MSKHGDEAKGDGWTLRCGDYREVLADVECDAVITDPPYSAKTHKGQRAGRRDPEYDKSSKVLSTVGLEYSAWNREDVEAFVRRWVSATSWFVAFHSHDLRDAYETFLIEAGRYVFAPLACVMPGMNVRLAGDGPANWTCWLTAARPRAGFPKWGSLPGAYVFSPGRGVDRAGSAVRGAKPILMMRAIVRDYSRKGDLVCDPCAGGGTTLLAAVLEGRRAIGAERDPVTYDKAVARLRRGYTPGFGF